MAIKREDVKTFKDLIIAKGWYGAVIKSVEKKTAKSGAEMGVVAVQLIDAEPAGGLPVGDWLNALNKYERAYVVTPDASADLPDDKYKTYGLCTRKFVKACGFDDLEDVLDADDNIDWQQFVGQELEVNIQHQLIGAKEDYDSPDDYEYKASIGWGAFRPIKAM